MNLAKSYQIIIGEGWFDAFYVRTLLDAESPERIKDIEGPESDALLEFAGWSFIEEPLHLALVDNESKPLALTWIAATTRGLNLTYIVAESSAGKGLATRVLAHAILAYGERRNISNPHLTVHAQYEHDNYASARVAEKLGLEINSELEFRVDATGRKFIGREAAWSKALARAKMFNL
jgi:RimJ/RimL family protein N-acetyltransferase